MGRAGYYFLAAFLGLVCAVSALRIVEQVLFVGLNSSDIARVAGQALVALLCGLGAFKLLTKARSG